MVKIYYLPDMSVFRYTGHAFQTKIRFSKLKNIRQQFMPWKVVK